ncbi:TonB-dependent receptor, partial [Lutibacter sp.]|uniref:TonB-dependent receptor domain-containing protein n=1 Tax=Lutibacter sp. TaxID=1925666 RepID=UPI0034A047C5
KYTSTGEGGKFDISGFKEGTYMLQIYLMTYQANQQTLNFTKNERDLGEIILKKDVNQLDEITINAIVPIKIKQDTVAFNTKAFKVKQDDNVGDLIKKLPGIQIGTDGKVSAQGEDVTKILVDGKEFFNNDQTIALQNLNADAIKSVQIIDEESDDTRTTGIKDGEKSKIINLVLKEGKKSGYFGKIGAGIGTNDRYTSDFDLNRFTANTQLALFGKLNNINNTGATVFRRDGSRGGNSGFLTTGTAGANYNYEFKKDLNFNLDYHFGYSDREEEEESERTQFTQDKSFTTERNNDSQNISNNHNVNFSLRDRSVEGKYLEFRGSFKNDNRESDSNSTTAFFDENNNLDANSERTTRSEDERNNGNLRFSYRKKLNEKGRNLRVRSGISFSDNKDMNFQNSTNVSDVTSSFESNEITTKDEKNKSLNYNVSFRYMEPIVAHHLISFSSSINNNNNDESVDQRKTINEISQNPFIYQLDYNKQVYNNQLGYVFSQDKIQVYLSGSLETMNQKLDVDNAAFIDNNYTNFLPRATVSYEYKKGKRLRLRYNKETELPSSNQVTPITNDFNPLYISVGNSNLTPEKNDNFNIMFYSHEFKKATSFFSFLGYTKTTNTIISSRSIDENYVTKTTFENYGSKESFRGHLNLSKKISAIGLRYNLRLGGNINDYTTIIDNGYNETNSKSWNFGLSLSNENKNKVDLTIGANYDFNKTTYSLQDKDRDYLKQNYYTKFDWDLTNSLTFNTQFDFSLYTDNNFDSQSVPIWNLGFDYAFLKGKRGNLKLQVFDILDKDLGIVRNSSDSYFEETIQKNLGTYAMLSFTYSLKPPTGKGSKRGGGERRGRRMHH